MTLRHASTSGKVREEEAANMDDTVEMILGHTSFCTNMLAFAI